MNHLDWETPVKTVTREHPMAGVDGKRYMWTRTALVVAPDKPDSGSILVQLPDGTDLCTLNISTTGEKWVNVDVVRPHGTGIRAIAWDNGAMVLNESLPDSRLVAVEIRRDMDGIPTKD